MAQDIWKSAVHSMFGISLDLSAGQGSNPKFLAIMKIRERSDGTFKTEEECETDSRENGMDRNCKRLQNYKRLQGG